MTTLLYQTTDGKYPTIYWFPNDQMKVAFLVSTQMIKDEIRAVSRRIGDRQGRIEDYRHWLGIVAAHRARFGDDYVPHDIRTAVNSVESGCNLPVTTWPALRYDYRPE